MEEAGWGGLPLLLLQAQWGELSGWGGVSGWVGGRVARRRRKVCVCVFVGWGAKGGKQQQ